MLKIINKVILIPAKNYLLGANSQIYDRATWEYVKWWSVEFHCFPGNRWN